VLVLHAIATKNRHCGLYESGWEIANAERQLGVDARIVDSKGHVDDVDRGVPIIGNPSKIPKNTDALVSHSGLGEELTKSGIPAVHVCHGRPHSTFLLDKLRDDIKPYKHLRLGCRRYLSVCTFYPRYVPLLEIVTNRRVDVIPPPCDLKKWSPQGRGYDFHGQKGAFNVVVTDMWRDDEDPFHVINAFHQFARYRPDARLHVYGIIKEVKGPLGCLLGALQDQKTIGETQGWETNLPWVYSAADLVISTHYKPVTRGLREAMACGAPILCADDCEPSDTPRFARMIEEYYQGRKGPDNRRIAEAQFNPLHTAVGVLKLIERNRRVVAGRVREQGKKVA
jgi:glycosyltransferase involved in cell wall biosynthesis